MQFPERSLIHRSSYKPRTELVSHFKMVQRYSDKNKKNTLIYCKHLFFLFLQSLFDLFFLEYSESLFDLILQYTKVMSNTPIYWKALLYLYKSKNTSLIFRNRTCWEEQLQTPNRTNLILYNNVKILR
jgi:hypothetical protein